MMPRGPQFGRLAFRREGELVNAYWAQPDTMAEATIIGSIRVSVCDLNPEFFERFKSLMRDGFSAIVFETLGESPDWGGEQSAPEHERAGRA